MDQILSLSDKVMFWIEWNVSTKIPFNVLIPDPSDHDLGWLLSKINKADSSDLIFNINGCLYKVGTRDFYIQVRSLRQAIESGRGITQGSFYVLSAQVGAVCSGLMLGLRGDSGVVMFDGDRVCTVSERDLYSSEENAVKALGIFQAIGDTASGVKSDEFHAIRKAAIEAIAGYRDGTVMVESVDALGIRVLNNNSGRGRTFATLSELEKWLFSQSESY